MQFFHDPTVANFSYFIGPFLLNEIQLLLKFIKEGIQQTQISFIQSLKFSFVVNIQFLETFNKAVFVFISDAITTKKEFS